MKPASLESSTSWLAGFLFGIRQMSRDFQSVMLTTARRYIEDVGLDEHFQLAPTEDGHVMLAGCVSTRRHVVLQIPRDVKLGEIAKAVEQWAARFAAELQCMCEALGIERPSAAEQGPGTQT